MSLKKNIYVVLTEYQFLQAVNIATGVYDSSEILNIIYIIRGGTRLMTIDTKKNWDFSNVLIIFLDEKKPFEIAEIILEKNPSHFLFFQGGYPLNVYLAYKLSRRGTEISLGPDGYGPYAVFNKRFHLLSIIIDSFKQNKFLFKNNLFSGKLHLFDYYKYGNHKFIKNLWITHPDQYKHRANNNPNLLKLPDFNKKCINFVQQFFDFSQDFPTEKAIYFFNQPLNPLLVKAEYKFVQDVLQRFPDKVLIIKLHPLTTPDVKMLYENLLGTHLIDSNIPAEVLLLSLNNCIVFTGWSAVLITENDNCNYYFNYPIYTKLNDRAINQIEIINLNHIAMISSADEMRFPNE
jgi:hypothetical protein